jgi:hypothetical protein
MRKRLQLEQKLLPHQEHAVQVVTLGRREPMLRCTTETADKTTPKALIVRRLFSGSSTPWLGHATASTNIRCRNKHKMPQPVSYCSHLEYMSRQQAAPAPAAATHHSLSSEMQITSAACFSIVFPPPSAAAAAGAATRGCCRVMAAGVVPLSRSRLAAGRLPAKLQPASPPPLLLPLLLPLLVCMLLLLPPPSSELQRL